MIHLISFGTNIVKVKMGISIRFVCQVCDASYSQRENLAEHYQYVHANGDELTATLEEMRSDVQMEQIHPDRDSRMAFLSEDTLTSKQLDDKVKPDKKKRKISIEAVSNEHKQLAEKAIEDLQRRGSHTEDLTCRLCDPAKSFTAYSTLLTHYRSHAGIRPFTCGQCYQTFTRKNSLKYHLMTHDDTSRFTCPKCNRRFRHPTHYKDHLVKHGDVEKIDCQFCKADFLYQYKYERHLQFKHKLTASDIDMIRKGNQQKMDFNQQRKEDLITIQKSKTFDLRVTESKKKRGGKGIVKSYLDAELYQPLYQHNVPHLKMKTEPIKKDANKKVVEEVPVFFEAISTGDYKETDKIDLLVTETKKESGKTNNPQSELFEQTLIVQGTDGNVLYLTPSPSQSQIGSL